LLFVACLFAAAAVMGALIESVAAGNIDSATYYFGRHITGALVNLFAMKMAAVFMISTCTIGLRTAIFPRWLAFSGYACALMLLVVIANWRWITLVFPIWMLLASAQILLREFGSRDVGEPVRDTSSSEH
jgi:CBS domain containing-hemolysin-like protein